MKKQLEVTAQTRQNLIDAFWSIYCKKRIEKISVREIALKSGYNRGTFYEYFRDVHDVLEQLENALIPGLEEFPPMNKPSKDAALPLDMFIRMYQEHSKYFVVLLGDDGDPSFQRKIKDAVRPLMKMAAGINDYPDGDELDYILEFMLSAMIGILNHWFRQPETIPVEKLIALMYDLMQNGVMKRLAMPDKTQALS
jgi:AcrR family transcriptional regulator